MKWDRLLAVPVINLFSSFSWSGGSWGEGIAYEGVFSWDRVMCSQRDRSVASNSLPDSRPADFFRTWDEALQHNAIANHSHSQSSGVVVLLVVLTDDQFCSQTSNESESTVYPVYITLHYDVLDVRTTYALYYKTRCSGYKLLTRIQFWIRLFVANSVLWCLKFSLLFTTRRPKS